MADNPGAYPLDPATEVGRFRLASGDTQSVPYDPPVVGTQSYTFLSDDEIEQFLAQGVGATNRAIGYWYLSLSGSAARQSKSVKDYDLQVDLTKRAEDLRKQAQFYFDLANDDDLIAGGAENFVVVPTGQDYNYWPPEGSPWRMGY